ncbi:DNA polymerase III subunit beta [Mycoplasmopsis ciconiae]|uniref:DNA polymerase III subunit beta n=1 Tax=Mycoplasmopsis ciconiae TaxID=561067 RepID=A0ABU7MLF4_9BACT|nr:DNA polymerase III subunit beta [Mycoplasmopsis ciconiae]
MVLQIEKSILDKSIEFMSKYVDSINAFIPFRCLKFDVTYQSITITASNGIISAKKTILVNDLNTKIEKEGEFLINCAYFKNIIKKLDKTINIIVDENKILIKDSSSEYKLNKINHVYPLINFNISENNFKVNFDKLDSAIKDVCVAAGDDNSGLMLRCINLSCKDNKIILVASDGYRLSTEFIEIEKNLKFNFSINNRNLKSMIQKTNEEEVELFYDDNKLGVIYKDTIIQSLLVDIPYTDVSGLFPKEFSRKIVINKNVLLNLINKVVFVNQEKANNRLQFKINKNELKLIYEVSEVGISQASTSDFHLEGDSIEIDFNYNFVKDAINIYGDDDINLLINNEGVIMLIVSENNKNNKQLITALRRY